ncbi:MAG: J domain-containing protein [Anaerolineae bacterium]
MSTDRQILSLRRAVQEAQAQLKAAEAELADRVAETNAFEFEFEARVGHLLDTLEGLEAEIKAYNGRIQMMRNRDIFGYGYLPADEQYRRTWRSPPSSPPETPSQPPDAASEARLKELYRLLARRFHPDLAQDEADRARRTEKMAAVNDAYAAQSLAELESLAQEPETLIDAEGQTGPQLVQALEAELARCRRRLGQVESELRNFDARPSVQLSLEVKLARHRGRDMLAEIAADLEGKIARKTAERDMLKAQFDQLGPDQGIIPIQR